MRLQSRPAFWHPHLYLLIFFLKAAHFLSAIYGGRDGLQYGLKLLEDLLHLSIDHKSKITATYPQK